MVKKSVYIVNLMGFFGILSGDVTLVPSIHLLAYLIAKFFSTVIVKGCNKPSRRTLDGSH